MKGQNYEKESYYGVYYYCINIECFCQCHDGKNIKNFGSRFNKTCLCLSCWRNKYARSLRH